MEKKHTDKKNYLSVRIKWCALLAAGLIGVVLAEMWLVHIREMRSLAAPTLFTALFLMLAAAVLVWAVFAALFIGWWTA